MSRHAAPVSDQEQARQGNLGAAVVAAVLTVALAVPSLQGRSAVVAAVAVLQALLVYTWVIGTSMPGQVGALLLGLGTTAGVDVLVYRSPHNGVGPILQVFPAIFVLAIVHQLCRGVMRVRVTESLSCVWILCSAVAALASYLALFGTAGASILSVSVTATGLAMIAGHLVDAVLPVPRFDRGVEHGLLGVIVATAVGAVVGWVRISQSGLDVEPRSGAIVGGALGLVAALVGVGVAYVCEVVRPRRALFAGLALPYVRALLPFAFTAPVALVLGTAVAG